MADCNLAKDRECRVVEYCFPGIIDDAAVPVCGVLAQADIGYDDQTVGS